MDILLLIFIALGLFFVTKKINGLTKISFPILYLIIGVFFEIVLSKIFNTNINSVFPDINEYNNILLLVMFFSAGFSIDIDKIKASGKVTTKMLFMPIWIEAIIIGIIIFIIIKLFSGNSMSIYECLVISGILAMSSPANIVPKVSELMQKGKRGKNDVADMMLAVSVMDTFTIVPLVLISFIMAIITKTGEKISFLKEFTLVILIILLMIVMSIIAVLLGKLISLIISKLTKKLSEDRDNNLLGYGVIIISFLILLIALFIGSKIPVIKIGVQAFGILVACEVGATIRYFDKENISEIISKKGNMVFTLIGMPIVFTYVGSILDLHSLLNIRNLVLGIGITVIAFTIKGLVSKKILDKEGKYTEGEKKFVSTCFIPKGVTLINFSVVFLTVAVQNNMNYLINLMLTLAAISILFTMTVGTMLLDKNSEKWLDQ